MRFHVLGLGPIGTLVSHHLCKSLDTTKHGVVLIHKYAHQLKKANLAGNILKVEREGVVDTSTAFRSEVFQAAQQLRYEERQEKFLVRAEKKARAEGGSDSSKAKRVSPLSIQDTVLLIESLIVAIKAYTRTRSSTLSRPWSPG